MELIPATWLTAHRELLPKTGLALDVACGRGRNALWLAEQGLRVRALDRDPAAIESLSAEAQRRRLPVDAAVHDLEAGDARLGVACFDVIVGVHYLHRPLFPALVNALRPGGLLIYETFTRDQVRRGKPSNPAFLLEHGELPRLVSGLTIVVQREGDYEGRSVASIVAVNGNRRPAP
jgi:SAM-dependent methyltransferase